MEWVVETVLPREVRKLASAIEKKDAAIALMNDDLRTVTTKYRPSNTKTWPCRGKKMSIRLSYKDVRIPS